MRRRTGGKLNVAAQMLLVAAILVVVNFISSRRFSRVDFTAGRIFTLAPATRTLLGGLKDIVSIDVYFSRKLPPYLLNVGGMVRDTLDEYRAYGGGNVKVRFIAPDDDPAAEQRLRMLGIPQVQLNVLDKDQFQVSTVYMGLAVLYGGKKEIIPVIQDVGNLEYLLTGAIAKITREIPVKVAMAAGDEGSLPGSMGRFSLVEQELARQYDFISFRFGDDRPVPEEVGTLIVAGARDLSEKDLFRLDQFVARGGRLVLLADAISLDEGSLAARRTDVGPGRLLKAWGMEILPEVVVDPRVNAPAAFSSGLVRFRIPYPWWPRVTAREFNADSLITSRLESLVMPWTSPLSFAEDRPGKVEYTVLASSSAASWAQGEPFDFTPRNQPPEHEGETKAQPLAVLATGVFRSGFAEGPFPEGLSEEEKGKVRKESTPTSVLVAGNSRFINDDFAEMFPGNALFFLNAVDWMAQGQDLIGIRSREATERPLPPLSEHARSLIRFLNIFALSCMLLLAGGVRFYLRRRAAARALP